MARAVDSSILARADAENEETASARSCRLHGGPVSPSGLRGKPLIKKEERDASISQTECGKFKTDGKESNKKNFAPDLQHLNRFWCRVYLDIVHYCTKNISGWVRTRGYFLTGSLAYPASSLQFCPALNFNPNTRATRYTFGLDRNLVSRLVFHLRIALRKADAPCADMRFKLIDTFAVKVPK